MKKDDPLYPLTRRLRQIARDATNTVSAALALFTGIKQAQRTRRQVGLEIAKLKQQVAVTEVAFARLDEVLELLEAKAGETGEQEFLEIISKLDQMVTTGEQVGTVWALDHISLAHKILKMPPERFPEVVRELDSHPGGKDQLIEFFTAVWRYYENEQPEQVKGIGGGR